MSRRPKLNISAVNKVDAVPLRKALELQQRALAEIAKGKERLAALEKEIAEWMETTNPDDMERIQLISGKKIQADILPGMIRRMEGQLGSEITENLRRQADLFRDNLRRFYEQANEVVAGQVADVLRPYFSPTTQVNGDKHDRALDLARQSDDCAGIHARIRRVESVRLSDQPRWNHDATAAATYDRNLAEAATELLMLAEES